MKYYYPKEKMLKDGIRELTFYFDNGECLSLYNDEIEEISLNFYDKLEKHGELICKTVQEGIIKLNISLYNCWKDTRLLINEEIYKKYRRKAIIERLLTPGITCILIEYYNFQNETIYGNFTASQNKNEILLTAVEQPLKGSYDSNNFYIDLYDINKDNVESIRIILDNCEVVDVYNDELVDINLKLNNKLIYDMGSLRREIVGGSIEIKLDKKKTHRYRSLFNDEYDDIDPFDYIYQRLDEKELDITHLDIEYKNEAKEGLMLNSLDERGDNIEDLYQEYLDHDDDDEDEYDDDYFVSGSGEINSEGNIVLKFE